MKPIRPIKPIPKFQNEDQERAFWAARDSTRYVDWNQGARATFPNLKLTAEDELASPIGSLISQRSEIRGGRPCIAGTSVSVRRIAQWHNTGLIPEEITRKFGHLSLAQVHAALACYHANQAEIDADLESEAQETEALEEQHRR